MARLSVLLTLAGLVALAAGCRPPDEIRHYTVPKQSESGGERAGPQRMLAVIVLQPSQGWFFKLTGAQAAVDAQADEFVAFLKSLRFRDETPAWSLPAGWHEEPGNQFRYATLKIDNTEGTPLEVSVTALPRGETDDTEYVLNNINRWRDQLGLSNITPAELARETKQVELDDTTATLVDLVGEAKGGSMSPPFASGIAPQPSSRHAADDDSRLKYQVPEGWREERPTGMRKASFRIAEEGAGAEVSITDLDASAGDLLPNVTRWREQIKLGPTTQQEIDEHVQPIATAEHEGQYLEMLGETKATIAVIVKATGRAWFIKLTGDKSLVERERDHFKSFVHSLAIGEATGANDGN